MGSGSQPHCERASLLGRWLALEGVHLLTGGGGGVMEAVSRAFYEISNRRGLVIGIVPCEEGSVRPKSGYPNPWVEIPIFTHLPLSGTRGEELLSRNHINVLSSDVVIALPGSAGTRSEVVLALSYQRSVVCYLESRDEIPGLPAEISVCSNLEGVQEFVRAKLREVRKIIALVEADHWNLSQEREFIENILCQRFNFLLVFYSLVVAGAFTTESQRNFSIVLTLGAIITSILAITIAHVQVRLDCILAGIKKQESHPTRKTKECIDKKTEEKKGVMWILWWLISRSWRKWIGYWIPLAFAISLIFGAICGWMKWLRPGP
jgi:uncharacterized protein (TIGR00725 family)